MSIRLGVASGDWIHPKKINSDAPVWGGSGWARVGQYLDKLPYDVSVGTLIWYHDRFVIKDIDENLNEVDVILMQRLMHRGLADHIIQARKNGQKVINDLDDWYWGLSTANQAWEVNHPSKNDKENIQHYKSVLNSSNVVITSTRYLLDRSSKFVRGPKVLVENTIDPSRFTHKVHEDVDQLLVGWVGSTSHRSNDIETVSGVFAPMAKRGEIRLYHGGHHPSAKTFASMIGVPDNLVETKPICPPSEYPNLMVMDVGIVPLNNLPFNMAKSAIKGLEYAAAGVPFIAQNLPSYVELHNETGLGLIAKKPIDWIKNINKLKDHKFRSEVAEMGIESVKSKSIDRGVASLIEIIDSL